MSKISDSNQIKKKKDCFFMISSEEAGRYLETYKVYENKPPDALMGQSEGDYFTKVSAEFKNHTRLISVSISRNCVLCHWKSETLIISYQPVLRF